MKIFDYEPRVEITAASGVLRVTIEPRASAFLMVLEAAGILLFSGFTVRQWSNFSPLWRVLLIWGEACAVGGWFYQLSGSEEVVFDPQKFSSRKNTLGWERTREYSVQECSDLAWKAQSRRDHTGLQCKVGWRTIHFCDYISERQADFWAECAAEMSYSRRIIEGIGILRLRKPFAWPPGDLICAMTAGALRLAARVGTLGFWRHGWKPCPSTVVSAPISRKNGEKWDTPASIDRYGPRFPISNALSKE